MKKLLAILTAAGMLLSMTVPGMAEAEKLDPRDYNPEASFYVTGEAKAAQELGSGEVKWSEEKTADGWMKVTNKEKRPVRKDRSFFMS